MAQEYDNENRGSIWKNDKKETEKHPDFTGSLNVNGQEFWVSAWKRRPDQSDKAPALSFSIKAKDGQSVSVQPKTARPNEQINEDEDLIPF
jgi:hypothetical protein